MKTGQLSALALVLVAGMPCVSALGQNKDAKPPRTSSGTPTAPGVASTRLTQPGNQPPGGRPSAQPQAQPQPGQPQPNGKSGATGAQPATTPQGAELTPAPAGTTPAPADHTQDEDLVMLPAFAEPVQLQSLVELVARTLKINVAVQGEVPGTVVFNAPIPVKKSDLIGLLDRLLEQQSYTITADEFGLYTVHPIGTIPALVGTERPTTRIIRTPNLRPSQLKGAIESQVGVPAGRQYAYLDELGVIMLTDTPRKVAAVERVVDKLLQEAVGTTFTRLELKYLAASVARQRALELVGATQQSTSSRLGVAPGGEQAGVPAPARQGALDNLADRLTVDQQGNALIFRGHPEEVAAVEGVLEVIDVPNNLIPRSYTVGTWALSIANIAKNRGLGEITTIEDGSQEATGGGGFTQNSFAAARGLGNQQLGGAGQALGGGPVMVVDASRGAIIYYATEFQHQQMEALIREIDPQSERVIIGVYKLHNSTAEDVAAVIDGIINNQQPVGTSDLLPNGGQPFNRVPRPSRAFPERNARNQQPPNAPTTTTTPGATTAQGAQTGELSLEGGGYVVADVANNQILVKAPAGQQKEFARLIEKLDLRRPQVYIEATIVAVNWSDEMRLAFETQLINAGGAGGLLNTNFGLSSFGNAQIWQPKTVNKTLGGLTGAIIKSDHVPIIVNALQTKANARVLSKPQLLVDDNETASIASLDTQPTSAISRSGSGAGDVITSGTPEEAGTKLQVTPHISSGGYLRLEYQAELSSFTGAPVSSGDQILSSPKQVNTIESASVTVPTDTSVVVGGLNFDSDRLTRAQIPLLGDIPLVGLLFQDRNSNNRTTTLYVFLTPRIMRDPTFQDLRLITNGPQGLTKLAPEFPPLRSEMIDVVSSVLPPRMPSAVNQEVPGRVSPAPTSPNVAPVEPLAPTQPVQIPLPETSPAVLPADGEEPRVKEQKGNGEAQPARTPKRGF